MAIRTFVAAAALAAFTTPALAANGENIAILDDSVSTGTFASSLTPFIIVTAVSIIAATADKPKAPVSTN